MEHRWTGYNGGNVTTLQRNLSLSWCRRKLSASFYELLVQEIVNMRLW